MQGSSISGSTTHRLSTQIPAIRRYWCKGACVSPKLSNERRKSNLLATRSAGKKSTTVHTLANLPPSLSGWSHVKSDLGRGLARAAGRISVRLTRSRLVKRILIGGTREVLRRGLNSSGLRLTDCVLVRKYSALEISRAAQLLLVDGTLQCCSLA